MISERQVKSGGGVIVNPLLVNSADLEQKRQPFVLHIKQYLTNAKSLILPVHALLSTETIEEAIAGKQDKVTRNTIHTLRPSIHT